jgi:hypothetical protein
MCIQTRRHTDVLEVGQDEDGRQVVVENDGAQYRDSEVVDCRDVQPRCVYRLQYL